MPFFAKLTFIFLTALLINTAQAGDTAVEFNIPAQNLPTALKQLAGQSRLQMLYDGPTVQGKRSAALKGRYTPQQALQQVLTGTGLRAVATGNNAVAVKSAPPPESIDNGSESTLPKVTVEADASYDPDWAKDPYNPDYVLPNATSGTKTDTPIMETPLNVQVISKQVLKDQQVITLDQALKNVSGVTTLTNTNSDNSLFLRGFQTRTTFRNGFRMDGSESNGGSLGHGQQFANVESVEVLKGPAAILFGRVEPGGMVNIVTKQPRATPYYSLTQQFGSYDLYRTSIDATGPLTKDDTLLYRMNASFQSNNTFQDLVKNEDVLWPRSSAGTSVPAPRRPWKWNMSIK
ncbi:MAG: TonB-dependent receptor plug domain-containing protein [Methyloglobulus sp.]|nr:TonB-dependent receptor plug domain-containing protein [Methyloglobulus sp.]